MRQAAPTGEIRALTSIRGIAALLMVFHHAAVTFTEHIPTWLFARVDAGRVGRFRV